MKKTITSALLALFAMTVTAQDTGTLKGVVKDKASGETIIGANVVWEADKSRGAATDFDGNFQLVLPAGKQNVVVTSIGYAAKTVAVSINSGASTELTVQMEMESEQLDMVIVSAGKFEQRVEDLTVSVSVIRPEMVENRGTTSAADAIEQTPGLTIMDSEPQMRGGSGYSFGAGARVMLLVDDLPIMSGDAGRPSWGFIPVENLEQIEVIKGASSVLYGSAALNGIINIRTAYPKDKPKTKVNLMSGFYSQPDAPEARWDIGDNLPIYASLNFFHSRKAGQWDIVLGGNFFMDNGYIGPMKGDTIIDGREQTVSIRTDADGNVTDTVYTRPMREYQNRFRVNGNFRRRGKKHSGLAYGINFNVMYSRSAGTLLWQNSREGVYLPFDGSITNTIQTTYNIDPFINYAGPKGSKHTLRTRLFHQNNDNDNNQGNLNYVGFGEYQYAKRFAVIKDFTTTAGAMFQYTHSEAELYAGNEDSSGVNTAVNAAGYLQLDKKFWNRLNVNGGVRVEYFRVNQRGSEVVPVFRLGLSSMLWKEGYLRASFGQGFRFPTIAERYIFTSVGGLPIVPNVDIQAERSWAAEIGLMQGIKIGKFMGYLDVAGFYQEYDNFVEFTAGKFGAVVAPFYGLAFKSINTGRARVAGLDASIMGNGQFTKWFGMNILLGYTYARPESLQPDYVYGQDNDGNDLTLISTSSILPPGPSQSGYDQATYEAALEEFKKFPILKYRFEHLINADLEFVFRIKDKWNVSIGGTYRYYSYMQNVDKIFYQVDPLFGWGAVEFRNNHNTGDHVFDVRAAVDLTKQVKLGFVMNNVANRVYALRPLKVNPPRSTQLQLTIQF
ncbi:MAG: TonB-dependent receptor [Flavobacteriales bacterium]|nr:TonB-dependent receptor [Flavobacteriales bacterium]